MNFNVYEKYNNVQNLMHYDMIIDRVKKKKQTKSKVPPTPFPRIIALKAIVKKNNYNVLKNVCR